MGFLSKLYESVRVNDTLVDHVHEDEIYNVSTQTVGPVENARINSTLVDHANEDDIYNVSNRSVGPVQHVRVNNTLVDAPNDNELYNASTQTIGSGVETVDSGTVTADDAVIDTSLDATGLTQGTPASPVEYIGHGTGNSETVFRTAATSIAGDNAAADLIDIAGNQSGLVVVTGNDDSSSTAFTDLLIIANTTGRDSSNVANRESPGTRSYSNSGTMIRLAIDDTGVTYNVTANYIAGGQA